MYHVYRLRIGSVSNCLGPQVTRALRTPMERRSVRASGQAGQDATHLAVARSKSWGPQRDLQLVMGYGWDMHGYGG